MKNREWPGWPVFDAGDIDAVSGVLASGKVNYWTGMQGREFERRFADFIGVKHGIAVANGTVSLEVILRGMGIGAGDEVVVSSRTFLATATAVVLCGAIPVFADIDMRSGNVSAETLAPCITTKTKALVVVHIGGLPCDMDPIMALAAAHDVKVIEDCAQAHGATYRGRSAGAIGHANSFSFCQDKIMTTGGEGGMITTDADDLWDRMWSIKDHGKSYDAVYHRNHPEGFRWLHEYPEGTNARMTEMQSVLGLRALEKLPDWLARRRAHAALLGEAAASLPLVSEPFLAAPHENACYKYYLVVNEDYLKEGWHRDRIMHGLNERGVPCFSGSCCEIYLEKALHRFAPKQRLPHARKWSTTTLMFLVHPTLTETIIRGWSDQLVAVLQEASRL
ncbi:MAG: DegT/DnrJ/EryC1/StrS aminotransferase family protein [Spartobacteria bacterium]|nr:DegT/DnrJ/EryC1/StrS aminotransferase family protein [Spartobacteria bacterium]